MRTFLVGLALVTAALAGGCQSVPQYSGNCPWRAQDAGLCTGPSGYGIALDPMFPS